MAERGNRENNNFAVVRRPSFRKSLAEADLPPEFLERLEAKRKALDDSIHKYIASKEREYKFFEKEVRDQHRSQALGNASTRDRRRSSAEDAQKQNADKSPLSAVDALMQNGTRHGSDIPAGVNSAPDSTASVPGTSYTTSGNAGSRAAFQREQDFLGVFTPQYLPMLETRQQVIARTLEQERANSAPPAVELVEDKDEQTVGNAMHRANSDTLVQSPQAQPKRPAHLQLSQRTSSSGSSVEGRLVSAMKSPTEHPRPQRKRVSLAVGDSIVAPSDNVPTALSTNSTPSHSRTRSSGSADRASPPKRAPEPVTGTTPPEQAPRAEQRTTEAPNGAAAGGLRALHEQKIAAAATPLPRNTASSTPGDDIGEFWHLEEPDSFEPEPPAEPEVDPELDDDLGPAITGRIGTAQLPPSPPSPTVPVSGAARPISESPEANIAPLPNTPVSATASQQPVNAGFRRPSVVRDPEYRGRDYVRDALDAEEQSIYGSSFVRPANKGSFHGGSLGESFMARHAAEMEMGRSRTREGRAG